MLRILRECHDIIGLFILTKHGNLFGVLVKRTAMPIDQLKLVIGGSSFGHETTLMKEDFFRLGDVAEMVRCKEVRVHVMYLDRHARP